MGITSLSRMTLYWFTILQENRLRAPYNLSKLLVSCRQEGLYQFMLASNTGATRDNLLGIQMTPDQHQYGFVDRLQSLT